MTLFKRKPSEPLVVGGRYLFRRTNHVYGSQVFEGTLVEKSGGGYIKFKHDDWCLESQVKIIERLDP